MRSGRVSKNNEKLIKWVNKVQEKQKFCLILPHINNYY